MKRINKMKKIALGLVGIVSAALLSGCIGSRPDQALYGPPPMEQDLYGPPPVEQDVNDVAEAEEIEE